MIIHNGIARKGTERVIFKYCIDINKWNEIVMPAKAKVLTVQFQLVKPVMWVETNPYTDDKETREFWIVGTGHEFDVEDATYIGTYQDGGFVGHVYERVRNEQAR